MLLVPFFRGLARHLHLACLAVTAFAATAIAQTNSPSAADGFDPNVDGAVLAMAVQKGDGKIIVGGQFLNAQPNGGATTPRSNIARFNPDGSLDATFDPNANGAVRAIVIQPNGQVIIAGDFTKVDGVDHPYICRLNPNGSPDTTFTGAIGTNLNTTFTPAPQVFALALQSDGSVIAGGSFGSAWSASVAKVVRHNIARFTATGALDTAYDPNADSIVLALTMHMNDQVLVGGGFQNFQPNGATTQTARSHIARLNKDGTLDTAFSPAADDGVSAIAVQPDGNIVIGGYFKTITDATNGVATTKLRIARLSANGSLDTAFTPSVAGNIYAIAIAPDGSILIGGHFSQTFSPKAGLLNHSYLARLSGVDGAIDDSFSPNVNADVEAIVIQGDGQAVIGGLFTRATSAGTFVQIVRNHIARVQINGTVDTDFVLDTPGRVLVSATQTDGKIVVGGSFTTLGGATRFFLARLNTDGTVDSAFNPSLNGAVYALTYDAKNNKILVGGAFTQVGLAPSQTARNYIARFNPDGSVDANFDPNLNGAVSSIALQSDGSILVGGQFSTATPVGTTTAVTRDYLLRLTTDGQVDPNFNPMPNNSVTAIALQSDGKIVVGGAFYTFQPGATGNFISRNYIARLNVDGTVDTSYSPGANSAVSALAMQSDDKVVVGGQFNLVAGTKATTGTARLHIARFNKDGTLDTFDPSANDNVLALAVQSDGKILVGGAFTTLQPNGATAATTIRYLARLNADGTIDNTVNLDLNNQLGNRVDYIALQPGGTFLIGGPFISLKDASGNRVVRQHLARINASGTLDATFDPQPSGISANSIKAISIAADGKILIGGLFADVGGATASNGVAGNNLARFNPEGTPDSTFNAALTTDGTVNAIAARPLSQQLPTQLNGFAWLNADGTLRTSFAPAAANKITGSFMSSVVLSDGSIVLAGSFSEASGTITGNMIKFRPDGSVDTTYLPIAANVAGMLRQPDDKIIIYGSFTTVNTTSVSYIARLNTDGTLDTTFEPNPSAAVQTAVLQSDGSVVIGGQFNSLTPTGDTAATTRNYAARITSAGKIDTTFDPNLNGPVYAIAINTANQIILGGAFTTTQPGTATTATTRNRIVRFNTDGTLDTAFDPNADNYVYALALQPDQKLLVGGAFTNIGGATHYNMARLNADGTADATLTLVPDAAISGIFLSPTDNSIVIKGNFTTVTAAGSVAPVARYHLARLTPTGQLYANFNPGINGTISNVSVGADNSVMVVGDFASEYAQAIAIVGGAFNTIGGVSTSYLAELNADGSVNSQFQPNPDQPVQSVLSLPDGSFIAGGTFTKLSGTARSGIARFDTNGVLDPNFKPTLVGGVRSLARQADGKILVGVNSATGLIRLNANGSIDGTFTAGAPFMPAVAIAVQADGKIVVAGSGSGVGPRVLRLNADGSVDPTFTAQAVTGTIETIALQTDGRVVVAGTFSAIGGQAISNLARLKANGAVDNDSSSSDPNSRFNPNVNGTVSAVALQQDGRLLIGGNFTRVGGLLRFSLARLGATAPAAPQNLGVSADGNTITWLRGGTASEVYGVTFEYSTDAATWTLVGYPSRLAPTNWQLTNAALPTDRNIYIRARGYFGTSAGSSSGIYESTLMTNLSTQLTSTATIIAPVVSSSVWDATHYVWTIDGAGVLRIADVYSFVTYGNANTALVNGGAVGGNTAASAARLADLSTRGIVTADSPLIGGFAIVGSSSRQVLIRAVGPGLAPFKVTNYLKVPQLVLYNSAGTVIATNSGWNPALLTDFARVGAFPFAANSTDSAFLVTLAPGTYTVRVADAGDGLGGESLVEVYDAGDLADTSTRLTNLSTRGTVNVSETLIGGLYVSGSAPKTMLVRGVGPSLAHFGVSSPLSDPVITVYDANGTLVATNDNWSTSSVATLSSPAYAAAINAASLSSGAFALDAGSTDAALVITLPAGSYTVQLRTADGTAGTGMIEVYELH